MNKSRILIVDDHPLFRRGLAQLLAAQVDVEVVGEAYSGPSAVEESRRLQPDVIVLDLRMRGGSGLRALPEIRKCCPRAKVLVLTMYDESSYRRTILAAGADGFVNKAAADTEVLQAVRSIRNGRSYFGMGASERELAWPDPKLGTPAGLSDREREVVRLIALGHTNREVASGFGISIKSVESYRARVMQKLGFGCRADLVRFALETGLIGGREEHPVMMD